ncbi:MAG TPA: Gfo/Idh/MocA family oxidoreductase [Acidimicrobiales bacterium]|nr:Gfo/Idh/MocA family oxidoreductase [Acidimicrobiales bacterium]
MHGAIVVGTSFGGRIHVPALRAAGIDVRALVGRDEPRTRARADALRVPIAATSLADALARADADCVTIATPPDARTDLVVEALGAGRHVLCEKPFARNGEDARRMVRAADASDRVTLVGCEFRWMPEEALARQAIAEGAIGEPRLATFVQHSRLVADGLHGAFNEEWWFDDDRGGGILNAGGIHYIDRFRTWLGEIVGVSARLQVAGDRATSEAEDTYTVLLRFESGCTGMLQHCAATHGDPVRLCRVVGSRGTVSLQDGHAVVSSAAGSTVLPVPDELRLPEPPPPSTDAKHAFTQLELQPYTRLAERFRALMDGERPPPTAPPTPTFHDGLRNQLVIDAMRASSRAGGTWLDVER